MKCPNCNSFEVAESRFGNEDWYCEECGYEGFQDSAQEGKTPIGCLFFIAAITTLIVVAWAILHYNP